MCNFHSSISDGKGNVQFFKPEDIAKIMSEGNKEEYEFNSHTSICRYFKITPIREDKCNKWEYDPIKKELKADSLATNDDRNDVQKSLDSFFKDKDIKYLKNMYGNNSGNRNSGNWNSGSGNSGNWNSGNWNNGNWNSGNWNSGNGHLNGFCSKQTFSLFNKPCTKKEYEEIYNLSWSWFEIEKWISSGNMTEEEKTNNPSWEVTGGYLKHIKYKDAWGKCPKEFIEKVKKLKNFDPQVFEEITGIKITDN